MNADNPGAPADDVVATHLSRLGEAYRRACSREEAADHALAAARLSADNLVELQVEGRGEGRWHVTLVGYDFLSELAVICGLFSAHGLSIESGKAFTYGPAETNEGPPVATGAVARRRSRRRLRPTHRPPLPDRKIVDWFTVSGPEGVADWQAYEADLRRALQLLASGDLVGTRGLIATRVADFLREHPRSNESTFIPVTVSIDNDLAEPVTRVDVRSRDSAAFLYELCNAFAMCEVNIERVEILTGEGHLHDVLHVTELHGGKITQQRKLDEIRVASVLIKQFTHLLPRAPNPQSALMHFGELMSRVMTRADWHERLPALEQPEVIRRLARLLGVSDFLWEDYLRQQPDQLMPLVCDAALLEEAKDRATLQAELRERLSAAGEAEERRTLLREFRDREMFRIDMRHILGKIDLPAFGDELTHLTEAVLSELVEVCLAELETRFGRPRLESGSPCGLCLGALGKFGGKEMGYGSDVELLFLYEGGGATDGPEPLSNAEFFERLVRQVREALRSRREGIFELDLRLRPHGRKGPLAVSLGAFRRYFGPAGSARQYERQALIKLRPVAGAPALREALLAARDDCVYTGWSFDVAEMRSLRRRQVEELVAGGTTNAKFSPGGLVDVEYTVQALQIRHGAGAPAVREPSTRRAIVALHEAGVLSSEVASLLRDSYVFLRRLIDALRMVRGNAKDLTVPALDSEELLILGRRLGYEDDSLRSRVVLRLGGCLEVVRQLSVELLGG